MKSPISRDPRVALQIGARAMATASWITFEERARQVAGPSVFATVALPMRQAHWATNAVEALIREGSDEAVMDALGRQYP